MLLAAHGVEDVKMSMITNHEARKHGLSDCLHQASTYCCKTFVDLVAAIASATAAWTRRGLKWLDGPTALQPIHQRSRRHQLKDYICLAFVLKHGLRRYRFLCFSSLLRLLAQLYLRSEALASGTAQCGPG